jgi:hypothetical protein
MTRLVSATTGALESQARKALTLPLGVFLCVLHPHIVGLEELVELVAGLSSEELLQFWLAETIVPVFLYSSAANASRARRDKSPPAALSRVARCSGTFSGNNWGKRRAGFFLPRNLHRVTSD